MNDRSTLENSRVTAFEKLSHLPAFKPAAMKLLAVNSNSESALLDFENIFRSDPALTAELLKLANSPAFGSRRRIETIRHALTLLGLERVRALTCNITLGAYVRHLDPAHLRPIWPHSVATAIVSEQLGQNHRIAGLYTFGLMHDLGRLALLMITGQHYAEVSAKEFANTSDAMEMEAAVCGMNHCDAGALLAGQWGFPEALQVTMVAHHDDRALAPGTPVSLVRTACRAADALGFPEWYVESTDAVPLGDPSVAIDSEAVLDRMKRDLLAL